MWAFTKSSAEKAKVAMCMYIFFQFVESATSWKLSPPFFLLIKLLRVFRSSRDFPWFPSSSSIDVLMYSFYHCAGNIGDFSISACLVEFFSRGLRFLYNSTLGNRNSFSRFFSIFLREMLRVRCAVLKLKRSRKSTGDWFYYIINSTWKARQRGCRENLFVLWKTVSLSHPP